MSAAQSPERTAYLVLGMHRSGTSALTQMLAFADASLPENVMAGDEHNAKGYFEPWKIAVLNDARLRAAGTAWDDVFAHPYRPLAARAEREWLGRAQQLFDAEYGDVRHPLLKDPRITVLLWTAYMLAAEAYTRDVPRAFVSYDGLLGDWRAEVARIEAAHGAPLPKLTEQAAAAIGEFLTPELRHNAADDGLAALGWAGALTAQVLAWFEAAATGPAPDRAQLDQAAATLSLRAAEMAALVSPVTRDLDATRAELTELRQQSAFEHGRAQRLERELEALRRACVEAAGRLDSVLAAD